MNLATNLEASAFFFPDNPAVRQAGNVTTYAQLNERANRIATGLIRLGVAPGEHIGLCALNSADWIAFYFGALKAGAVAVTLSGALTKNELAILVPHAKPRMMFTTDAKLQELELLRDSAGLEKIIAARGRSTSIGFGAKVEAADDRRTGDILKGVEPEDLLKFGLIPEFIGRVPVIATLDDLDEEALMRILTEPKNALVRQYQRLFEMEDVQLTFAEEAMRTIAKKAIERKTGARGLRSIMESILLDTMFELPSLRGVEEVVISSEVVEGKARPLRIYSDRHEELGTTA
jgi:hypothetical protein